MENITSDCSIFPDDPHKCDVIIALRRTTGALSLVGCAFVIFLIWLFKKYTVFTQRMILYLSIAAFLVSVAYLMGELMHEGGFCRFQGWFLQFVGFSLMMWVACVTFNLFMNVVKMISTEKFEIGYHIFCWGLSLLLSLLPFAGNQYGPAEAWCWVKSNWGWRFGVYYIPLFTVITGMVITYSYIIYTLKRQTSTWQRTYDPDTERRRQMMKEEIKPLVAYPFVYIAIFIFPIINRIQNAANPGHPVFALVLLQAITSPMQGAVNAVIYGMDKETFKRLTASEMKIALQRKFQRTSGIQEYPKNIDMEIILERDTVATVSGQNEPAPLAIEQGNSEQGIAHQSQSTETATKGLSKNTQDKF